MVLATNSNKLRTYRQGLTRSADEASRQAASPPAPAAAQGPSATLIALVYVSSSSLSFLRIATWMAAVTTPWCSHCQFPAPDQQSAPC